MKRFLILLLAVFAVTSTTGCVGVERVRAGYVGIKVNDVGEDRGVDEIPLQTGWVWYNPFTQSVYVFPTFRQTQVWTADRTDGSPINQSITFNSVEGAEFNVDISISYSFVAEHVPNLFVTFKKSPEQITNIDVYSYVRDSFTRHAGRMEAVKIFGSEKQALLDAVRKDVQEYFGPLGFNIHTIGFVGSMRMDDRVKNSINAVLEQAQAASREIEKIRQDSAQAIQKIIRARADSAEFVIRAQGQAEADRLRRAQLTREILQAEWIKKWDGKLPTVQGSEGNLLQIPVGGNR